MATVAEQLQQLNDTKSAIKTAISNRGVAVADTDTFRSYADKIGEIQGGGGAPATKFGVSIDNILGDVDANGNYIEPSEPVEASLAGIKNVPAQAFVYKFSGIRRLTINANDVISVGTKAFLGAFGTPNTFATDTLSISFDNLEEIVNAPEVFVRACDNRSTAYNANATSISFKNLKKISNSRQAFYYFASQVLANFDQMFPSLEEISGDGAFENAFDVNSGSVVTLSKIKKITGSTSTYSATFYQMSASNTVWNFPSATEFTGYVFSSSASYAGEIHFAAANQAAIEACEGYSYKWGFAGATIYFDL